MPSFNNKRVNFKTAKKSMFEKPNTKNMNFFEKVTNEIETFAVDLLEPTGLIDGIEEDFNDKINDYLDILDHKKTLPSNLTNKDIRNELKNIVKKYDENDGYMNISKEKINEIKRKLFIYSGKGFKYYGVNEVEIGDGNKAKTIECDSYIADDGNIYFCQTGGLITLNNMRMVAATMRRVKKDIPDHDNGKLDTIVISYSDHPNNSKNKHIVGEATEDLQKISLYDVRVSKHSKVKRTIYHEVAHIVDQKYRKSDSKEWKEACEKDHKWSSNYAYKSSKKLKHQYSEDYAESVANLKMMGSEKYQKKYPNRYKILEKQYPYLCYEGENHGE